MRRVACAVVRRGREVLAFRHPLAGAQLVKGGIEPGETVEAAALRELVEEAGVAGRGTRGLTIRDDIRDGELWHLVEVETGPLPEAWVHRCADDGGHDFAFFWHRPGDGDAAFAEPYRRVLRVLT